MPTPRQPSSRELSRVFSRPVFKSLSSGRIPSVLEGFGRACGQSLTVAEAFDRAYTHLWSDYRSEYLYKNEVVSRVVFGRHSPSTAAFLTEFRAGQSVADAVVFNGTSSVYEIKSEHDSLDRLAGQLADYLRIFDKVHVVTHESHVSGVLALTMPRVGVLCLNDRGYLSECRPALSNKTFIDPVVLFGSLRRGEYLGILERTQGWSPDVPPGLLAAAAKTRFATLAPEVAHDEAVKELRKRTTDLATAAFVGGVPRSLRTLALSEPLSRVAQLQVGKTLTAVL